MSHEAENPDHEPTAERKIERHPGPVKLGQPPLHGDDLPEGVAPEDLEGEIGAEGGSGSENNHTPTPFHPAKDGTALGDTDQHSNA